MFGQATYRIFLLLFVISLCPYVSSGQHYFFENFSVENGLPQSQVNDILVDSRGYIWFATAGGGICKYDGVSFTTYDEKDGLGGKIVNCIAEDKFGNIWIGSTWGGVTKYDGKDFYTYPEFSKEISSAVTALACDSKGAMWVGCSKGIYTFNGKDFQQLENAGVLPGKVIRDLYLSSKGTMWIATNSGIAKYTKSLVNIDRNKKLPHDNISSIYEDSKGNMWFGTEGYGAFYITAESIKKRALPEFKALSDKKEAEHIIVTDIAEDDNGSIWVATHDAGLIKKAKDGKTKYYTTEEGLPSNSILSLSTDNTGCLWIGTNGAGTAKFQGETFEHYFNIPEMKNGFFFSVKEDADGNIWAGTSNKGLFKLNTTTKKIQHYHKGNNLPGNSVRDMVVSGDSILIACDGGFCIWNGSSFKIYTTANGLPHNEIRSIYKDSKGNTWLGTYGKGLILFSNKEFKKIDNPVVNKWVHSMIEGDNGTMFFGTEKGLAEYSDNSFELIKTPTSVCNTYIGSIAKDKWGNIWVGTDRCIAKYNGNDFTNYTEEDGLTSTTVYLLQNDNKGNLWVGTNKGLDKLTLGDKGKITKVKHYGKKEGFLGVECNTKASCITKDGNLWFGTIKGLTKYNHTKDKLNEIAPRVHITNVNLFFSNANWRDFTDKTSGWHNLPVNPKLPHKNNHLTFGFVGINHIAPEKVKYRFMVEGFDNDWSPVTEKTEVNYYLPPGDFKFMVKAANEDGVWSEPSSLSFSVMAPFWKKWWFYLVCIVVSIVIIYLFILLRTKQLATSKKNLEKEIKGRISEIKKQSEEKDILIKEIHHRVKNNLQVISSLLNLQSSFINDESALTAFKECQNRVSSMALIHEKLYQTKDLSRVSVKEYITSLINNLTTTYNIDKHIAVEVSITNKKLSIDTLIPLGLLLNELISNSFKYAFSGIDAGKIVVNLEETGKNEYKLLVGDNGIGMPEKVLEEKPKTLGMELIQILVGQLNGSIERVQQKGTFYRINFTDISNSTI